jgi:hypothetical protein
VRKLAALLLGVFLLFAGCGPRSSSGPVLEMAAGGEIRGTYAVGEEAIEAWTTIKNGSDGPVTLRTIEVSPGRGLGDVVDVLRVEVAPRAASDATPPPPLGTYSTYPPTSLTGECVSMEVHPVPGWVLGPQETSAVLIWIRIGAPGRFEVPGYRVVYEHDGQVHEQTTGFSIAGTVRTDSKPMPLTPDEEYCVDLDLPGVRDLRQGVTTDS